MSAMVSMYEMLKNMKGPGGGSLKDPRKLLANVWIIRDEFTGLRKTEHPWLMIEKQHPPEPIYRTCLISSDNRNLSSKNVTLPAGTIDKAGRWSLPSYVVISEVRPLPESVIDKGEHKLDLPDDLKLMIDEKLRLRAAGRLYRKPSGEK